MKKILFAFGTIVWLITVSNPASAAVAQTCAIINGGTSAGPVSPSPTYIGNQAGQANEGCNVLITFNADGSIVTTHPNAATSYDTGPDDNLIGIVNLTNHAITSLPLSSATIGIFGFDGDGVCDPSWTFSSTGPTGFCTTTGYGPSGVTFSGISSNFRSGTVNFGNGGIAAGSSGFFSLEGPVADDLTVTPEPASVLLISMGLLGLGGAVRLKKRA